MLDRASDAIVLLNEMELLPVTGVLLGMVWFMISPTARQIPLLNRTKENDRK